MRTVAIVQARMGSTRLPGKVLMDLEGETVLARGLKRVAAIEGVDQVVVATTTSRRDDPIVLEAARLRCGIFRGSEEDVLGRYLGAAAQYEADVIVRITSDCPLIDPQISGLVVARLRHGLASGAPADYCSNTLRRTYPRGLDTEAITREALERTGARVRTSREREHVTLYVYEHPQEFRLLSVEGPEDHARHRWTVDTPDDLRLARAIYARLGDGMFGMREVLSLFARLPRLMEINSNVEQKVA